MRTSPETVRIRRSTCPPPPAGASATSRSDVTDPLTDWASIHRARPGRVATWTSPETQLTRHAPPTDSSSTSPETVFTPTDAVVSPMRTSPETVLTVTPPPTARTATSPEADFVVSVPATAPAVRSPLAVVKLSSPVSASIASPEADRPTTSPRGPLTSRSALCVVSSRSAPSGQRTVTRSSGLRPRKPSRPSRFGTRTETSCRPPRSTASIRVSAAAWADASSPRIGVTSTSTRGSSHVLTATAPAGTDMSSATRPGVSKVGTASPGAEARRDGRA